MFKGILSPRKSFDEQRNGWLEISEIVDIVKEPDGNLKIAENAHDIKLATEDADQKTVEQDFGTDDEAETKRKMFAQVDRAVRKSLDLGRLGD